MGVEDYREPLVKTNREQALVEAENEGNPLRKLQRLLEGSGLAYEIWHNAAMPGYRIQVKMCCGLWMLIEYDIGTLFNGDTDAKPEQRHCFRCSVTGDSGPWIKRIGMVTAQEILDHCIWAEPSDFE